MPRPAEEEEDVVGGAAEDLASRVSKLREILQDLKNALHDERLNLRQEIEKTLNSVDSNGHKARRPPVEELYSRSKFNDHEVQEPRSSYSMGHDLDVWKVFGNGDEQSYHESVNRIRYELDFAQSGCILEPTPSAISNFYKQKILNIEADFSAGLNQVKNRFVESIQTVDNYQGDFCNGWICPISEQRKESEIETLHCSCDLPTRSRSLVMDEVQSLWSMETTTADPYCDREFCGLIYQASALRLASSKSFDVLKSPSSTVAVNESYPREFSDSRRQVALA